MGRKKLYHERMVAAFRPGTFKHINIACEDNEDRTDFIRIAALNELAKRANERGNFGLAERFSDDAWYIRRKAKKLRKKASSLPAQRGG